MARPPKAGIGLNTKLTLIGELRNSNKAKNVSCFESFDFFNRRLIIIVLFVETPRKFMLVLLFIYVWLYLWFSRGVSTNKTIIFTAMQTYKELKTLNCLNVSFHEPI